MEYIEKRNISASTLQLVPTDEPTEPAGFPTVHFTVLGPAKESDRKLNDDDNKNAIVMSVFDLDKYNETGNPIESESVIVLPSVVLSRLNDAYPNESYVGLSFRLQLGPKKKGSNGNAYRTIQRFVEIESTPATKTNKKEN